MDARQNVYQAMRDEDQDEDEAGRGQGRPVPQLRGQECPAPHGSAYFN